MPDAAKMPFAKLRSLEMLRAIAALLVVGFHTQGIFLTRTGVLPFGGFFDSGFRGVDLFFVLSGFIIAHVHGPDIGRPGRLANYAFNRAARIYPSVWIMSAFAVLLYASGFGGPGKFEKLGISSVAASLLLLPQTGDALVNVTWTLKYEVFFYVVFAVLILNRKTGLLVLGAWQIAVLVTAVLIPQTSLGLGGFYLRSLCLEFSLGLGCAWLIRNPVFIGATRAAALQWGALTAGGALFAFGMAGGLAPLAGIPCALGATAIVIALVLLESSGRLAMPGWAVMIGGASYAIYLVHFSAISLLATCLGRLHWMPANNAVFFVGAGFGVGCGVAFDGLIDQPIQRALRRHKPRLIGVAAPAR